MNIVISIEHPAWAHQFYNIIKYYMDKKDNVLVLAVDKDGDIDLLEKYGIKYSLMADTTGENVLQKGYLFIKLSFLYTKRILSFRPDVLIGRASPMMAIAAFISHRPHIIFEDTEVSKFSLAFCKIFSRCIITPMAFLSDLGHKQRRLPIYKELFYLHPDVFTPESSHLDQCGMNATERFIIIRFIAWNASHDIGKGGIGVKDKISFVENLAKYVKVYISSESEIPTELIKYKLPVSYEKVHHAIYYASLVISEGATMAAEAAMLGTYAFYLNSIVSGINREQSDKYRLLRILENPKTRYRIALSEAIEMLRRPKLWQENKEKRKKILDDMINPNEQFIQCVDEYCHRYK